MLLSAQRLLLNSYIVEAGIEKAIFKGGFIYTKVYFEHINNDYVNTDYGFRDAWNKEPFVYRLFELGFAYVNKRDKVFNGFIGYSNSNGRGFYFFDTHQTYTYGMRIIL